MISEQFEGTSERQQNFAGAVTASFLRLFAAQVPEVIRGRMINSYINVGVSKFVMRPVAGADEWNNQIKLLGTEVLPRIQTPFSITELQERAGETLLGKLY